MCAKNRVNIAIINSTNVPSIIHNRLHVFATVSTALSIVHVSRFWRNTVSYKMVSSSFPRQKITLGRHARIYQK